MSDVVDAWIRSMLLTTEGDGPEAFGREIAPFRDMRGWRIPTCEVNGVTSLRVLVLLLATF